MNDLSAVQERSLEKREIIAEYEVKGHLITIYRKKNSTFYTAKPLFDFNQDPLLFTELVSLVHKNQDRLGRSILGFDELVDTIKSICLWKILEIENLPIDPEVFAELFIYTLHEVQKHLKELPHVENNDLLLDQVRKLPTFSKHYLLTKVNSEGFWMDKETEQELVNLILEYGYNNVKAWSGYILSNLKD